MFQCLGDIFDKVVELAMEEKRGLKQILLLRTLPTPQSGKSTKPRPDAVFILKEPESNAKDVRNERYDYVGTCEFAVKDNEGTRDHVGS